MEQKINIFSFFSGAGFLDLGFELSGHFNVVYVNEFHKAFNDVYKYARLKMGIELPKYGHHVEDITKIIGTPELTKEQWAEIQQKVTKGGANIINLRGRSSFQSPSYVSIEMIAAAMGGKPFRWPAGTYVSNGKFDHIMMAWETSITKDGCHLKDVKGTPEEEAALEKSYEHLCALRDEVIAMGVLPPVAEWNKLNPNIK